MAILLGILILQKNIKEDHFPKYTSFHFYILYCYHFLSLSRIPCGRLIFAYFRYCVLFVSLFSPYCWKTIISLLVVK